MGVPAQHYDDRRGYNRRPSLGVPDWAAGETAPIAGMPLPGRYYFVCEALAGEAVGIEELRSCWCGTGICMFEKSTGRVRCKEWLDTVQHRRDLSTTPAWDAPSALVSFVCVAMIVTS